MGRQLGQLPRARVLGAPRGEAQVLTGGSEGEPGGRRGGCGERGAPSRQGGRRHRGRTGLSPRAPHPKCQTLQHHPPCGPPPADGSLTCVDAPGTLEGRSWALPGPAGSEAGWDAAIRGVTSLPGDSAAGLTGERGLGLTSLVSPTVSCLSGTPPPPQDQLLRPWKPP